MLYNLVSIAHALTILFGHMYSLDLPNEYMWPQMFVVEEILEHSWMGSGLNKGSKLNENNLRECVDKIW